MDERPSNVVEELLRDGVADHRSSGVIPRTNDVKKYIADIVETMERRDEEARLRIKPKEAPLPPRSEARSDPEMESEYLKRCKRFGLEPMEGSWTVTRAPIRPERKLAALNGQRQSLAAKRLRARLRLLRSKPDWAAKIQAVNPLALQGQLGEEKQKHAEHLIREVIKASNATFGPWMKDPTKRLWFG